MRSLQTDKLNELPKIFKFSREAAWVKIQVFFL